jgi:transposase
VLNSSFIDCFLPEGLLVHFGVVDVLELGDVSTKKMIFEIHLDERNSLPEGVDSNEYESKGFLPSSRIQDFPIRGKAVYLVIRRRRWRHKTTGKKTSNNYSYIAEGSRLTQELSDFLKGTGRDPRRYDK